MRDLTKWPRLLVKGESVTEHQANEILIRTNPVHGLHVNDQTWNRDVARAYGIETDQHGWHLHDSTRAVTAELGILPLSYLENQRIASSWIGGPHGWCDWDGTIGCATHNIGKWPSTEDVTEEWQAIAAAFPYLDLTAQLVTDEGEGELAAEWRVQAGAVELREPGRQIRTVAEPSMLQFLMAGGERGVSLQRLEVAIAQVRATIAAKADAE